jgi:hypothetical protein
MEKTRALLEHDLRACVERHDLLERFARTLGDAPDLGHQVFIECADQSDEVRGASEHSLPVETRVVLEQREIEIDVVRDRGGETLAVLIAEVVGLAPECKPGECFQCLRTPLARRAVSFQW